MEEIILQDYARLIPVDEIAIKHNVSVNYVISVIHYFMVTRPVEISKCKSVLEEFEI